MNWQACFSVLGTVIKYLGGMMAIPLFVAIVYGEAYLIFLVSMLVTIGLGLVLERSGSRRDLGHREALVLVALAWLFAAIIGTIPYLLSSVGGPSPLAHPINAFFESMSGFTTTGATVMEEISFQRHSHALLMWRQLTQWLGGMGIIVLMIAILPELAVNGAQLMQSEAPGPHLQKLTPRIAQTARILWLIYIGFTLVYIALLYAVHVAGYAPNMDLYNAIAHGFTTLPTGGFSPQAQSIAAFSAVVQWIVIPFIVIAGVNFALFWHVLKGDIRRLTDNVEFRSYAAAIAVLVAILFVLLTRGAAPVLDLGGATEGVTENTLRQAVFQIMSLLNSTGFATSDFAQWDTHAQMVLLFAMFIGGSAGSTGGGIKVIRWVVTLKAIRRELYTTVHPRDVRPVRLSGYVVDEDAVKGILVFTALYLMLMGVSAVLISLDSARIGYELTSLEAVSASLATIGNIGPGFGSLGPFGNYLEFSGFSKLLMSFQMWVGRLEIIPVLALFINGLND